MRNIDKTGLPGKLKVWIYQHGLPPRISWPIMLYEITLTRVEKLERTINRHLRKWLGVPPSFTTVGLLRHKDIVRTVAVGRRGLGTSKSYYWKNANTQERRNLVQREIKYRKEENRQAKAVELGSQGAWLKWELEQRSLTWSEIWRYPQYQLQCMMYYQHLQLCRGRYFQKHQIVPCAETEEHYNMYYQDAISYTGEIYMATQLSTSGTG
ncbi:Hypothetical predicted protein [Mytilus galloprovincialis]|uniref:Uncharacterized protein n=1 Tax=Mytilus galloprovincialis TaxID=29158 RepID=A0A8B6HQ74_MYTGA|nr:Hypothetical predicted protein [Mytilus galloprovincialis]